MASPILLDNLTSHRKYYSWGILRVILWNDGMGFMFSELLRYWSSTVKCAAHFTCNTWSYTQICVQSCVIRDLMIPCFWISWLRDKGSFVVGIQHHAIGLSIAYRQFTWREQLGLCLHKHMLWYMWMHISLCWSRITICQQVKKNVNVCCMSHRNTTVASAVRKQWSCRSLAPHYPHGFILTSYGIQNV